MKKLLIIPCLLLTGLTFPPAFATTPSHDDGGYFVYGAGNLSCGTWLSAKSSSERGAGSARYSYPQLTAWVAGYVSGAELTSSGYLAGTDADGMYEFISQYCLSNPLKDISDATMMLVIELTKE